MTEEKKHELPYQEFIKQPIMLGDKELDFNAILENGGEASFDSIPGEHTKDIVVEISKTKISIQPDSNKFGHEEYIFEATVNDGGILSFMMYLKNDQGERYPGFPYGGQLAYHSHKFLLQHNKITQVSALWLSSDKDNITLYMDAIGRGNSPSEAANETKTGKILNAIGYTNAGDVKLGLHEEVIAKFYPKSDSGSNSKKPSLFSRFLRRK